MLPPDRSSHTPRPAGFTLIEMMVVVVILSIMATMIVPRLTGNERREFKLAVEQVGDLLTMYAQRERTGQKVVGLGMDRSNMSLHLMTVNTDTGGQGETASWHADFYVKPVLLPRNMQDTDIDFVVEGDRVDPAEWPIANELGQPRPQIEITMRGGGEVATLTLAPYSLAPTLNSTYEISGVTRARIDLDNTGHSREDW